MPEITLHADRPTAKPSAWQRFLGRSWSPPRLEVAFPDRCPHCMGEPTKRIAIWDRRVTAGNEITHVRFEVPACGRVMQPIWAWLLSVALGFVAVVAALALAFGEPVAGAIGLALALALLLRLRRHRRWARLVRFDHGSYQFAFSRADYASAFARANGVAAPQPSPAQRT